MWRKSRKDLGPEGDGWVVRLRVGAWPLLSRRSGSAGLSSRRPSPDCVREKVDRLDAPYAGIIAQADPILSPMILGNDVQARWKMARSSFIRLWAVMTGSTTRRSTRAGI